MKFEQFENGKQNKSEKQENLNDNESPKQERSFSWLEPKKIFYKKGNKEIQQSQTEEKNRSSNEFIGIKFLNEKFQFFINDS